MHENILALIADLYAQITSLQSEVERLRGQLNGGAETAGREPS